MAKSALKKSVLRKVPVQMATAHTISQAKRNEKMTYFIKAAVKIIDHKRMLLLHVYHRENLIHGDVTPLFRIFMTKEDYISQYYKNGEPSWRTGRMESMMDCYWSGPRVICSDDSSEKAIQSYLSQNSDDSAVRMIMRAQTNIMEKRLQEKHQKIMRKIDRKMRLVKELPKDFNHWVDKTGLPRSRYIYYQYSRRKYMDGYCTHCEQEVKVSGVKHRSEGLCPNCGAKVTFLAESRAKHVQDWGVVAYFQKTPEGFVIRHFSVTKRYGQDYRHPELFIFELKRDFFDGNEFDFYEWRVFRSSGKVRWCDGWIKYYPDDAMIYTKNLDKALKGTRYQYCALKEYALNDKELGVRPYNYLYEYRRKPYIEYLVKLGLNRLVYELCHTQYCTNPLNSGGNSIPTILGVPKQDIHVVQELDMSMNQLSIYKKLIAMDIRMNGEEFLRFYHRYYDQTNTIFKIMRYTTLHKAERYCEKFVNDRQDYKNILHTWKDYIDFCEELGYDLRNSFVLFPKKLQDSHDEAAKEVTRRREEAKKDQIRREERKAKELLRKYQKFYPWTEGEFCVVVPKDLFEIKEEGQALHHCVGTYTSRVANEQSIILFVRRNEQMDKPFYTMEVQKGKIIQCRGYSNQNMTEEVKAFVEQYTKKVLNKIWLKEAV